MEVKRERVNENRWRKGFVNKKLINKNWKAWGLCVYLQTYLNFKEKQFVKYKNYKVMMKRMFLSAVALMFCAGAYAQTTYSDLIISEYFEGTSNNKAIEIYNGTGATVDLSQYSWKKETNGKDGYKPMTKTVMTGTLENGATFVIVNDATNPPTDPLLLAKANLKDAGGVMGFNGNDAIALFKGDVLIDAVGVLGNPADWGKDVDMRRICDKGPKPIYDATEWEKFTDLADYSSLGSHCGADVAAPTVKAVQAVSNTSLKVTFGERVTTATAGAITNYAINKSVTVSAAALDESAKIATLTISAITNGEEYTLTVSNIADIAGNVMAAPATKTFIFGSSAANTCATMADLRAKDTSSTTIYTLTGPVEVIALGSQRNQKWIADATGGILIDDQFGAITETYAIGDNMSMVQGTLSSYFGLLQFIPTAAVKEATATVKVSPAVVTLSDMKIGGAKMDALESSLITVKRVKFADAVKFANGKNYRLIDGTTNDSLMRTHIYGVDYIGQSAPAKMIDIIGVLVYNRDKFYITPRSTADMKEVTSNEAANIGAVDFEVYPNPATDVVNVKLNDGGVYTVSLIAPSGAKLKEFSGVTGSLSIDLTQYRKGMYLINVAGKDKASALKIIKK